MCTYQCIPQYIFIRLHRIRDGLPSEDVRGLKLAGLGQQNHEGPVRAHSRQLFPLVQETRYLNYFWLLKSHSDWLLISANLQWANVTAKN